MTFLYLVPSTDQALSHALQEHEALRREHPLQPHTLLLPQAPVVRAVHSRLGDAIGVRLHQFYSLARMVLDAAARPVYQVEDPALRRLVSHLLSEMQAVGELGSFEPVCQKPGFHQVLLEWLREMKSQGIDPDVLSAYAANSGRPLDRQLSLFYHRYQAFLQSVHGSDKDGLLWLAAEALENDPALLHTDGAFFVAGFDLFTPIQVRILRSLAGRFDHFSVYLMWDTNRDPGSLALARLDRSYRQLNEALQPEVRALDPDRRSEPALEHLVASLFEPHKEKIELGSPLVVQAIAAPDREAEVRTALREIKRRLVAGAAPEKIAMLAPQPEVYRPIVETVASEYGLPVACDRRLKGNPAIGALAALLQLAPAFPWRQTLDCLRSPYIRQSWLSAEQVDLLERLSRERPVLSGRNQWQFALHPLRRNGRDGEIDDDDLGPPPLAARLDLQELAAIEAGLMAFFDHLTPPEPDSYSNFTLWLQEAVLGLFPPGDSVGLAGESGPAAALELPPTLDLLACAREGPFAARDLRALGLALDAIRDLLNAAQLVPPGDEGLVAWEVYRRDLIDLLAAVSIPPDPHRAAVRFGPIEAGRALAVDDLYVLGLSEGEFPAPPTPDVFYSPSQRRSHPLPLAHYPQAEQASLWWQVVANCRQSLTLLRPRLDENGAPWEPSPYWDAVMQIFSDLVAVEPPIAAIPQWSEAAGPAELLVAAAQECRPVPPELADTWSAARRSCAVDDRRRGWEPAPPFEGVLAAPDLLSELTGLFGPQRSWSASRLNRYGNCPFGFFAQYVLVLEDRPDPEDGLDAMQRGSLLHAALERLHRELAAGGLALNAETRPAVLERLDQVCDRLFPEAPRRFGFRPGPLWEQEQSELHRLLVSFTEWECRQAGAWQPCEQELRFGLGSGGLPALVVRIGDLEFQVHGVIDRLDRGPQGAARVIDYKSGSTTYSQADIENGLALQAPLYALAAERLVPQVDRVKESSYVHLSNRKQSGRLSFDGPVEANGTVRSALESAAGFVRRIRAGNFPVLPAKPLSGPNTCSQACDYTNLCRVNRRSIAKARRGGEL